MLVRCGAQISPIPFSWRRHARRRQKTREQMVGGRRRECNFSPRNPTQSKLTKFAAMEEKGPKRRSQKTKGMRVARPLSCRASPRPCARPSRARSTRAHACSNPAYALNSMSGTSDLHMLSNTNCMWCAAETKMNNDNMMNDTMQIALRDASGYAPARTLRRLRATVHAPPRKPRILQAHMHMLHNMRFAPSVCLQMA